MAGDAIFDVMVIGAGLSGIAFARFYLDVHPTAALVILESDNCVGGVWNRSRVFDGFWSQSGQRLSGFSDVPLELPTNAPRYCDTYEAKYMTEYLERYVRDHTYDKQSLESRTRFGHVIEAIEKGTGLGDTWKVTARRANDDAVKTLEARFLAVASGLTSRPKSPQLSMQDQFQRPIIHQRDFARKGVKLLASSCVTNVTVLGGGKSAADMVYTAAKANKNVSWIIPPEGNGPAIFMDPKAQAPYRNLVEAGSTRRATALNPSCFALTPDWAYEQHRSLKGGQSIVAKSLARDQHFRDYANYAQRPGASSTFHMLEPRTSFFWSNGPLGMIQHDDFWDIISQNVQIYRCNIHQFRHSSIELDNNVCIESHMLLCGTGWRSDYAFLTDQQAFDFGLPSDPKMLSSEETQIWKDLTKQADTDILQKFPVLAYPPEPGHIPSNRTPARLYNGIVPLTENSIVFLGRAHMSNAFRASEAQAIWATAYLDGAVSLPPLEEARRQVAYMNAFSKWRYPAYGSDGLYFFNDLIGYTDKLLRDIGLHSHRKEWWTDWDAPCLASDLRDAKDEYVALVKHLHERGIKRETQ